MMLFRSIRSGRSSSILFRCMIPLDWRHNISTGSGSNSILGAESARDTSNAGVKPQSNWVSLASAAGLVFGTVLCTQPALNDSNAPGNFFFNKLGEGPPSTEGNVDIEKAVQEVREGVRERLKAFKLQAGLPPLTVVSRGQQVAVRFPVPPACDIYQLVVDVISRLGGSGVDMTVRAWSSAVARQLVISHPDESTTSSSRSIEIGDSEGNLPSNKLCVVVFEPLLGEKTSEIEFLKKGRFTSKELDTVVSAVRIAAGIDLDPQQRASRLRKGEINGRKGKRALETLEKLGVKIYGLEQESGEPEAEKLSWDTIAGYHDQKREIEDNVLLALKRPEVYDSIARGTRHRFESNRPRAVLFEGPPGTGKTSCARVIASQAGVPLLYVPLEVVTSKYYGESERLLSSVFNAGNELPDGAIVFLDEIDSLATTRDTDMHEATRRMLSVLLRQMDGFEQDKRIVVIAATNRKQDLDPALLSRFDASITFDLPDFQTREEIAGQYARHLNAKDLSSLAAASEGMSGRDLRDVCQQAERRWASKLIKGLVGNPPTHALPPIQEYIESADKRRQTLVKWAEEQVRIPNVLSNKVQITT